MKKVSIIIPIYNSEKYLNESILSVINQTYSNLEIILVNDGSTDNSLSICKNLKDKDSRIKIITTKNQGVGKARKKGILQSTGDFLCFLDSDDIMLPECIEEMINKYNETYADLIECSYYIFNNNKYLKIHQLFDTNIVYKKNEFKENIIKKTIINGKESILLWNKMYKRDLFIKFISNYGEKIYEDYIINMQYYITVNTYCYISKPLIKYRITYNSLSHKYHPNLIEYFNNTIIPLKKYYMNLYGINTEIDKKNAAYWYINNIYNYLYNIPLQKKYFKIIKNSLSSIDREQLYYTIKHYNLSKVIYNNYLYWAILLIFNIYILNTIKFKIKKLIYSIIRNNKLKI